MSQASITFKEKNTFETRKRISDAMLDQYPDKIPLIIERYNSEKSLPMLDKIKYLVPYDMTMGTLSSIIRKRLQLNSSQSLFILVNEKNAIAASNPLINVYRDEKDEDGFLYMIYASQESFG